MNKKLKVILSFFFFVAFCFYCFNTKNIKAQGQVLQASNGCETRGVWLNPSAFKDKTTRKNTLERIKKANINTIFVLSPPVEENKGHSTPESFSALLNEAKNAGLSAHGWITGLYRVSGKLSDFRDPSEQEAQKQWALDLLSTYPKLDGVHLDYIRFKDKGPIEEAKVNGVSKTVQKIYQAIKTTYPNKFLTAAVKPLNQACADWNSEYIPPWYQEWFSNNPNNRWSNCTWCSDKRGVPGQFKFQQDAESWVLGNSIDHIIPMAYETNDSYWKGGITILKSFFSGKSEAIYGGIGWYTEDHFKDPGHVVRKIKAARSEGIKGFVIFEFGKSDNDFQLINALTINSALNNNNAPYKNVVPSCLAANSMPSPSPIACPEDVNQDGNINIQDSLAILSNWGTCSGCKEDINSSGSVDVQDLLQLLSKWGSC